MVRFLESISEWTGRAAAWLATLLVLVVVLNVVLRYLFSASQIWLSELGWHTYATLFLQHNDRLGNE